jgi:hypothetical protein
MAAVLALLMGLDLENMARHDYKLHFKLSALFLYNFEISAS